MLGVEAVAERMSDHVVGHHPTMPGVGKTAQAVIATRRLEDSSHAFMMTILSCLCKTMVPARSAGQGHPTGPAKYDTRLVA
jgi:ABC-type lipoprotein release transport system permease subunit